MYRICVVARIGDPGISMSNVYKLLLQAQDQCQGHMRRWLPGRLRRRRRGQHRERPGLHHRVEHGLSLITVPLNRNSIVIRDRSRWYRSWNRLLEGPGHHQAVAGSAFMISAHSQRALVARRSACSTSCDAEEAEFASLSERVMGGIGVIKA